MSRGMKISILGLYLFDKKVFDGLNLPSGMHKQTFIDMLIKECSDLELMYPDWDTMRYLISSWSSTQSKIWSELLKSTNYDFNPLENYDRYEDSVAERDVYGYNSNEEAPNDKNKVKSHIHGNIGVTTSAQMLMEYRGLVDFDAYAYIINQFKHQFCILVY